MNVKISTLVTWAALLVLSQLLITQWTVNAAGNRDVLDFISFAGTVVGMILAMLAIIYSYLSNASQRNDSEAIRAQVTSLNDAIARANTAGNQFSAELIRLEDIRQGLSEIAESSLRIEKMLVPREELEKAGVESAATPQQKRAVLADLAKNAIASQVILYYIALQVLDWEARMKLLEDIAFPALVGDSDESYKSYLMGQLQGYKWVFGDLSLGEELTRAFKLALIEVIPSLEAEISATKSYDPAELRRGIYKVRDLMMAETNS